MGEREGPRGNVWWLSTRKNKNDIYIGARAFADVMKISLHQSGIWRLAFTSEYVSKGSAVVSPSQDRAIDKWERPPEFMPGVTKAFEIVIPGSEVTAPKHPNANIVFHQHLGGKEIVWVPAPLEASTGAVPQ